MINLLKGKVEYIGKNYLIIDINGVGFGVFIPKRIIETISLEDTIKLFIYTCVKENEISLYGFDNVLDKEFFLLLISISGVGPKAALSILSVYDAPSIAKIILNKDNVSLSKVPGIGHKTAQRVILELQEKAGLIAPVKESACEKVFEEVIEVLVSLGCDRKEALVAVNKVKIDSKINLDFDNLLTESLKLLSKKA